MIFPRTSGILLHPTSLPSPFGIGDLGNDALRFADFLAQTHQHLWQMLPLGPTGHGNSPYQSLCVFAGNPMLISPERLLEDGFLDAGDLADVPSFPRHRVAFKAVTGFKARLFRKSFAIFRQRARPAQKEQFEAFCRHSAGWLSAFALYAAVREAHQLHPWNKWDNSIKMGHPEALDGWGKKLKDEIECLKYQQYQFARQWEELKNYCHKLDISLIGDIPIFVAMDSADVWLHPEMFYLDNHGRPTVVAGVPPDYFARTGQLWGSPIYRWADMAQDGYAWWIERFQAMRNLVDIIRLDHFRGFQAYWEVPGSDTTAINGRWVPGPGAALFEAAEKALGPLPIIAEDLGLITPDVEALREKLGFPGMRVLQFAFNPDSKSDTYKPYNYPCHCVVYTATHDNDTTVGWFKSIDPADSTLNHEGRRKQRKMVLKYTGTSGQRINWDFIRLALMSTANTAIIPLQDVMGLGSRARMNRPGIAAGNWRWRFTGEMLTPEIAERLKDMTVTYGRG
ncbi:MAG: 4-alpha-glucanotransferase [Chloroflexota bacterium]